MDIRARVDIRSAPISRAKEQAHGCVESELCDYQEEHSTTANEGSQKVKEKGTDSHRAVILSQVCPSE